MNVDFRFILLDRKSVKYSEYILSRQGFERKINEQIDYKQKQKRN